MATYVLVHGAWHSGELLEETAAPIRAMGHEVFLPTLAGNRPGDVKSVGLEEAIQSLVDFFNEHSLQDAILVGHSYGGMAITGAADRIPRRIRRLVYSNAFVPNHGERLNDLVPRFYIELFDGIEQEDGGVMLPFPIWREAFINDAPLELAQASYASAEPAALPDLQGYHPPGDEPGGDGDPQIVHQLHRGYRHAAQHALAPAALGKIGAVPPGADAWQPRAVFQPPEAARRKNHGSRARLSD